MRKYFRHIFFTKAPLTGVYKCADLFQIYPIPIYGIPSSKIQKHFPNFIEFYTTDEDNVSLETPYPEMDELISGFAPPTIKQDLFLSLLTTGTNHLFFRYDDFTGSWGMPVFSDNPDDYKGKDSKWCIPFYLSPVLEGVNVISGFSDIKISPVARERYSDYFLGEISDDKEYSGPITVPTNLQAFIECYHILEPVTRIVINNAILHLKNGVELSSTKKTLSLISLFTSLETMVDLENRGFEPNHCKTCNQLVFSVSKKFKNFLSEYVSNHESSNSKFNKLYTLRSKIVHTGKTLDSELLYSEVSQADRRSDELKIKEVIQICRVSIINWVIKKAIASTKEGDS